MTPNTPQDQTPEEMSPASTPAPDSGRVPSFEPVSSSERVPGPEPVTETGIKSRLSDAQKEMLARKSRGGSGAGWQSTGKGHKPTQASGKQAKTEKKVRW
ncbi:hypothetical protein AB6813_20445 [bacterium RCC_150]